MVSSNKRKEKDVMKLLVSEYEVQVMNELSNNEFVVKFHGPKESAYEGGTWRVRVILPDQYPYKSPSIGFVNRIFHPNIDEASGSVCLDVINQTWSPMFDLINIFDIFLPQLLLYPNPTDPLNAEAAALHMKNDARYKDKIKEYVKKYATEDHHDGVHKHLNGKTKGDAKISDKHSDISELSQTSDIEAMDEDDDDIGMGSDEEEKEQV